jgi:dolichol-phosphate mannosyltransferase
MTDLSRPRLSVVAPCYNEEGSLPAFVARMASACRVCVGEDYELLLVNDGSRDKTWAIIEQEAASNPRIAGVNLARNHGHQLAVTAGLSLARGERVMIIDADLQDPPELLSEMWARMDEGYDVVYGRRRTRAAESRFKLATASLFYKLLGKLAEIDIPRDTGDFRLMSRLTVDRLNAMPERDRFIRGMVAWLGGRQTEFLYDRDARHAGETHYTLGKMLRLAVDGVTSFSTLPLRLASVLAGVGVVVAGLIVLYALVSFFTGDVTPGWTSMALITVFFATAQLACLGVVGAYLGRTYMQVKGRPLFLIDEIVTAETLKERR